MVEPLRAGGVQVPVTGRLVIEGLEQLDLDVARLGHGAGKGEFGRL